MSTHPHQRFNHVMLISTPWPLFNRPSIQLGSLKSFLRDRLPDIDVATEHVYFKIAAAIGYELYQAISKKTWLSESVYASLLYPKQRRQIEVFFLKHASKDPALKSIDFNHLIRQIKKVTDDAIQQIDWSGVGLAGVSVCLCQLTSAIYFAKQIKTRCPEILIAAGGSILSGPGCLSYLDVFPCIDIVVNGEGELPLLHMVQHLRKYGSVDAIRKIDGIVIRHSLKVRKGHFFQMENLDGLPSPDYDDYFTVLNALPPEKKFFPTLPVETSRGCWWHKGKSGKGAEGCAFCNLNLQWEGYRNKDLSQSIQEIDFLTDRHQTLSVAFMDNVLPAGKTDKLFSGLRALDKDIKGFAEVRATTSLKSLKNMKKAGMHEIQVGIEALSTPLLKKMNKGATAIQNLEMMKNCEEIGLKHGSNLILHFPGSDLDDVQETLRNIEFAEPYRPLKPVFFWLGLDSPVWRRYRDFNIRSVSNHPNYRVLFPRRVTEHVRFSIQAYRGDLTHQRKIWKAVRQRIQEWERFYADMHQESYEEPILGFRDGKSFLIICQRRHGLDTMQHRLKGTSRKIYLFCRHHRSIQAILDRFPDINEDALMPFLRMMADKRLMFQEGSRYLSLAVRMQTINILH